MGDIVKVPLGTIAELDLAFDGGKLKLSVDLKVVDLLKQVRVGSTNAIENAILDVAIKALEALAPVVPPVV